MTIERFFGTWALLAVAMTLNGMLREGLLVPWLGRGPAEYTSALLGAAIILAVTRVGFRRFAASTSSALMQSALLLVTLTVVFETLVGLLADDKNWTELLSHYAFWRGELWPWLLLLLSLTPFLWGRWLVPASRRAR